LGGNLLSTSSTKIYFSLIGAGGIGFVHAWAAKVVTVSYCDLDPNSVVLNGVYNRTISKAEALMHRFGFKYVTNNWRDIINDGATNAISVATANAFHEDPVIMAADKRINILCEKPLGINYDQAKRMYEKVNEAKVINSTALVMRFMPSVIFASNLINSGKLGKIYHYRAVVAHSRFVNPDLPIEWRMKKDIAGGGALADIGIHLIDLARYLIGEVKEVSAITKIFIKERKTRDGGTDYVDVDDAALMIMEFENGAIGSIEATRFGPGFQELDRIEIHGSNGMIRFYLDNPYEIYLYLSNEEYPGVKRIVLKPAKEALWPPSKSVSGWGYLFVALMHDFFKAILDRREASPNFYDALKAQEVLEAAYISAERKEWVQLPL